MYPPIIEVYHTSGRSLFVQCAQRAEAGELASHIRRPRPNCMGLLPVFRAATIPLDSQLWPNTKNCFRIIDEDSVHFRNKQSARTRTARRWRWLSLVMAVEVLLFFSSST